MKHKWHGILAFMLSLTWAGADANAKSRDFVPFFVAEAATEAAANQQQSDVAGEESLPQDSKKREVRLARMEGCSRVPAEARDENRCDRSTWSK